MGAATSMCDKPVPLKKRGVDLAPDTDADELKEAFKLADKNGNGYLERAEILALLKPILDSHNVSEEKTNEILDIYFEEVDTDHDGKINYEEFVEAMKEEHEMPSEAELLAVFIAADMDHSGFLSEDEMTKLLKPLLEAAGVPEAKIHEIIVQCMEECDTDHDGKIDYDEFIDTLR